MHVNDYKLVYLSSNSDVSESLKAALEIVFTEAYNNNQVMFEAVMRKYADVEYSVESLKDTFN